MSTACARLVLPAGVGLAAVLAFAVGCRAIGQPVLSLVGLQSKALQLGLAADAPSAQPVGPLALLNPFQSYKPLSKAIGDEIDRPVEMGLCLPLMLDGYMHDGLFQVAIITPAQYLDMPRRDQCPVLAVALNEQQTSSRPALLLTPAESGVSQPADLKGKVVLFGPPGDARTHAAGIALLSEQGVARQQLSLELLPLPGSLRSLTDSDSIGKALLAAQGAAGFVDQAAFDRWPARSTADHQPSQDRFRILGKTAAVPDLLVIASPRLDAALSARVAAALQTLRSAHAEALIPLRLGGFEAPPPALSETFTHLANARGW